MFFWWLVVGLIVATLILLVLLLAPFPMFLHIIIVDFLDKLQKPLYVVLIGASWILFGGSSLLSLDPIPSHPKKKKKWPDATLEMNKHQAMPPMPPMGGGGGGAVHLQNSQKWRSERNFYMCAYCWTLLLILLRCHSIAHKRLALLRERDQLVKSR